jgi:hypothetical protein
MIRRIPPAIAADRAEYRRLARFDGVLVHALLLGGAVTGLLRELAGAAIAMPTRFAVSMQ